MLSTTTILTLLPYLVASSPLIIAPPIPKPMPCTSEPCGPFTLVSSAPHSPFDNIPITAHASNFYLGLPTTAFPCPIGPQACSLSTNVTAIVRQGDGTAHMASVVPQQIFVNATDGALSYNPANGTSLITPANDMTTGFTFKSTQPTADPTMGIIGYQPEPYRGFAGFYACPAEGYPAGVHKILTSECPDGGSIVVKASLDFLAEGTGVVAYAY